MRIGVVEVFADDQDIGRPSCVDGLLRDHRHAVNVVAIWSRYR
jgi:hypothetical protein